MADLFRWARDRKKDLEEAANKAQGVYHQVNPWDGGRTYDTNQRGVRPGTPNPRPIGNNTPGFQWSNNSLTRGFSRGLDQVNPADDGRTWEQRNPLKVGLDAQQQLNKFKPVDIASRTIDQINTLDGGLTWKQRTPLKTGSAFQQATHSGTANVLGHAVKPAIQFGNTANLGARQAVEGTRMLTALATGNSKAGIEASKRADVNYDRFAKQGSGLFKQGTFFKNPEEAKRGDLKTVATRVGGGTLATAATVAPVARGGSLVTKGIATKAAIPKLAGEGAAYNAAFGAGQQLVDNGKIDPKQVGIDAVTGAVLAPATLVGGRALLVGGRKVAPGVQKTAQAVNKADAKAFSVGPGTTALRAQYKQLNQQWQKAGPQQRKQIEKAIKSNLDEQRRIGEQGFVKIPDGDGKQTPKINSTSEQLPKLAVPKSSSEASLGKQNTLPEIVPPKSPLDSLKQEASLYRGMNATEWNDVFNGGVSANKKNGLAFVGSKDDAVMATEAYGRAGKKGNVIVEYKPEARKKLVSGENLGQNTGGSNLSGEYQAKGLGLSDIARVTDENGKVIYEATQSQPPKSTLVQSSPLDSLKQEAGYRSAHQIDSKTARNLGDMQSVDDVVAQIKSKYGLTNYDQKDITNLKKIVGNPEADVKIYRASPVNELNDGDWVTTSKTYANDIKRQNGGRVYEYTVKAKELNLPQNIEDNPSLARFSAFQYKKATQPKGVILSGTSKNPNAPQTAKVMIKQPGKAMRVEQRAINQPSNSDLEMGRALGLSDDVTAKLSQTGPQKTPGTPRTSQQLDPTLPNRTLGRQNETSLGQSQAPGTLDKTGKLPDDSFDPSIAPSKEELEAVTNPFLGAYQAAKTKNVGIARTLPELDDDASIGIIDQIENGITTGKSAGIPQAVRNILDAKHQELKAAGVDIGYLQNYFPHRWKNAAQVKKEYQALNLSSGIQKPREFPTVKEGMELGFQPLTKDYRAAIADYLNAADRMLENRKYFDNLKSKGMIVEAGSPQPGMQVIDAPGLPKPMPFTDPETGAIIHGNYYAVPDVAKNLNKMFGDRSPHGASEKTLHYSARISRALQDIGLSGGVPGTPLNAFTFAQVTKELMAGRVASSIKATFKSFSKESYGKYLDDNKEYMQGMQRQGIQIRDDYNLKTLGEEITNMVEQTGDAKNAVAKGWDKVFSDPTFRRFMPVLQLEHYKKMYNKQIDNAVPKEQAEKIAADSVANFYGLNRMAQESFRSQWGQDAASTVLFAPKYRESMWNFLVKNNIKALSPTTWNNPAFNQNRKFIAGMAMLYAAQNAANYAMNGVAMKDNPDGKKDKMIIPKEILEKVGINTGGKDIATPFLPSIATVPRYLGGVAYNTATGNAEQAMKDASGFLSFGLRPLTDAFVTNENYFGDRIVEEGANPLEAAKQRAGYLATAYQHPYIREGIRTLTGKNKSVFETIARAGETPIRFYDPKYYKYDESWTPRGKPGQEFTMTEQRDRANIKKEMDNLPNSLGLNDRQKAEFDSLNSVEFSDDGKLIPENNPFYKSQRATALQDDKVFEAMKQKALLKNKLNGQPVDPLYTVSPQQRRVLLWKDTLPQGTKDPTISAMYSQEWYQDFRAADDQYFRAKKKWNKSMGYEDSNVAKSNPYPEPSKQVEKKLDHYYTLPSGTGARSAFLRQNPDVLAQWDKVENWKNGERMMVGLGPIDSQSNYSNGGRRYASRGGRGRGGSKRKSVPMSLVNKAIDTPKVSRAKQVKITSKVPKTPAFKKAVAKTSKKPAPLKKATIKKRRLA